VTFDGKSQVRALIAGGLAHHRAGRLADAEGLYRSALRIVPRQADALHLLGVLAHQRGTHAHAVTLIEQAIAVDPAVPSFHNNLGNALLALNDVARAGAAFQQTLRLKPDHADARCGLASVRTAQGDLDGACTAYRQVIAAHPGHPQALAGLGAVLARQGKTEEAIATLGSALSRQPNDAGALTNLGNVLRSARRVQEAEEAYRCALRVSPGMAEAAYNLALILLDRDNFEEAAALCRSAIGSRPDYADAFVLLAAACREQGRAAEAQDACREALRISPDHAGARLGLLAGSAPMIVNTAHESAAVPQAFARALEELAAWSEGGGAGRLGGAVGSAQPFYLAYRPFDSTCALARYGDLVSSAVQAEFAPAFRRHGDAVRARPLVGVVSGQVRTHPVWDMILRGIVSELDRTAFDLAIFHTGALVDGETEWACGRADRFVQGPLSIRAWIGAIGKIQPDILFFPEIGMDPTTLALAAMRLAPLQIAGWGHPITTGLPTIDRYMSGDLIEPADGERHYRERLLRLPGTAACTLPAREPETPWDDPGRRPGTVRFALCQQPSKYDPGDDALIVDIAREVGDCEFWLVVSRKHRWASAALADRLSAAFAAGGIKPARALREVPWLDRKTFPAFLDAMDVYLDCPSFSGYTTAHQALGRGLPLVTLEGRFMRQRLAAGLLRRAGVTETIAFDRADYVAKAVAAAERCRDPGDASAWRAALRAAAPLADGDRGTVRALEAAILRELAANSRAVDADDD
jgi:protein O-GlcNAc transferase